MLVNPGTPTGLPPAQSAGSGFTPKLVSIIREGYTLEFLRADAIAGLTVAIVALPLSMALAIASGATPDSGLFTAIVGGFVISLLSGSRFQIGGPAGAFIVLVASIIERKGFDALTLSTFLAGILLLFGGLLRLGSLIRFIPHAVIVGFTSGIAVLIFASQIHDIFGLALAAKEPSELIPRVGALWSAIGTMKIGAVSLSVATFALIMILRWINPAIPGMLIAVALATLATFALGLSVETIGSRFGGIASGLPHPALPVMTQQTLLTALPDALSIALLGGVESLLSAVVADGMSNRRHRSNAELLAQGAGNIASSLFGGICVTGTIARTATNIRSGAKTPVAGLLHSLFLLIFIIIAAPLAARIPLASLAAVLAVVCWNMFDKQNVTAILRGRLPEIAVLVVSFFTTIFIDLITGILAGCVLAAALSALPRRIEAGQ